MNRKIIETSSLSMRIKRLVTGKLNHYIDYYIVAGVFLLLLSSIVISVTSVLAATSVTVDYKAQLIAKDGFPITLATTVQFSIYNHLTGGSAADTPTEGGSLLWTETYSADTFNGNDPCEKITPDSSGNFSQRLGTCTPLPSYLKADSTYYIGVTVGADSEASPRIYLSLSKALSGGVPFVFEGDTDNDFETTLVITDPTGDNIIVLPDDSGTVVLASDEGDLQISGNLLAGTTTSSVETLINPGFFLDGDDLFVAGSAGIESFIYTNAGLTVGASTTYADGSITLSSGTDLNIDSGTLFIDSANNRVGIGTTSPGGLLGLKDSNTFLNVDGSSNLTFTDAVTGTKTLAQLAAGGGGTLTGLTDTTVAALAAGNLLIYDGVDSWDNKALSGDATINSSGVLTISTDAVALTTDTAGNYVASITNGSGISGGDGGSEGAALTLSLSALTADWNQNGAFDILLNNSASELKILENGGTPSLFGVFDVADLTTADKIYTFPNATGTVMLVGAPINLTDNVADAYDLQEGTNNYLNINTTDVSENISFGNATTNPSYTFLGTGNVGIGTTSPSTKLEIDTGSNTSGLRLLGNVETSEIADMFVGTVGELVLSTVAGTDTGGLIEFRSEDDEWGYVFRESDGTGIITYLNMYVVDAATDYVNLVVNATQSTTGLVITDAGNVGIGTNGPTITLALGDTDTGFDWQSDGNFEIKSNTQRVIDIDTGVAGRLVIFDVGNALGGNACEASTEVLETDSDGRLRCGIEDSDERLKNVVAREVLYGLDEIIQTELIQYTWNELAGHSMDDGIDAYQGFSGQNLLKTAPQLVFIGAEGYYGVDQNGLIATAWNAIRELNTKVDETFQEQQGMIRQLGGQVEELQEQVLTLSGKGEVLGESNDSNNILNISEFAQLVNDGEVLQFTSGVEFMAGVTFHAPVTFNADTVGSLTIPAGETKVKVTFSTPFEKAPIVNLTPTQSGGSYSLKNVTKGGFEVVIEPQGSSATFNWTAFISGE